MSNWSLSDCEYFSDSDSDSDEPCKNRECDMGTCAICYRNNSGGRCLREGCGQDCSMEYEECWCDCMKCGGISEPYLWCVCGSDKLPCLKGTLGKLTLFQSLWRGYFSRKV